MPVCRTIEKISPGLRGDKKRQTKNNDDDQYRYLHEKAEQSTSVAHVLLVRPSRQHAGLVKDDYWVALHGRRAATRTPGQNGPWTRLSTNRQCRQTPILRLPSRRDRPPGAAVRSGAEGAVGFLHAGFTSNFEHPVFSRRA